MKIGAIIQARASSTRLPGKVLMELPYNSGITVLQQVIRRLKKANKINEIIVATTVDKEDDRIVDVANLEMVKWFRGSKDNVLERYYLAAKENKLDVIVRLTSDCPCIDPEIVDNVIEEHLEKHADYTSNVLIRTFPHGMDTEIINFNALEVAHQEAKSDYEKEHVMPYIYKTKSMMFKIAGVEAAQEFNAPDIRVTLDTNDDYILLCAVFDYLYPKDNLFKIKDIVNLFHEKPWLKLINKKVLQKKMFDTFEDEMEEALKVLDLQELKQVKVFLEKHLGLKI
ncbi:MAG TPA: acylneuraminate cytidylyltransferase [Deltaproteobacteria bacterium]|nr:acylneuraminate cytidylyltransferase [Deltaproteobacteria bacterium]